MILFRYLLPLCLAISAPCLGQSDFIKSDLITAPDSVPAGATIVVQIKGDLPYEITPKPQALIRLRDDDGNRVLLIQGAVSPGYEIKVDYQVIHPTEEETKAAPWDDRAAFAKWLKEKSRDEFFQDSHTVKVGTGPGPTPGPDNLTDTGKKVLEWAKTVGNAVEAKQIAENYATILSGINAGAYNSLQFTEARAKIVSDVFQLNQKVSANNEEWGKFFRNLAEHLKALDAAGKLDSVAKIKAVFEEIKAGLEAFK